MLVRRLATSSTLSYPSFQVVFTHGSRTFKKKVAGAPEEVGAKTDANDDWIKRIWLLMPKPKPEFTPEEAKRRFKLGREKVKNELREHNERQKQEMIRIKLKWAAVNALPTPCREAAMVTNSTNFPEIPVLCDYPPPLRDPDNPDEYKPPARRRWKFISTFAD